MEMLSTLALMLAGIGAVLIALGVAELSSTIGISPKGWMYLKYGAIALAVGLALTALNSSMNSRKSNTTVQNPPQPTPPWNYRNPNTGGQVPYDQTCGYRPGISDPGYNPGPQYPGPGGNYNASRQFYIVGTISSGPAGSNLALESGASTVAVAK